MPRPISALGLKHPTSEFSRMAINFGDINPRFRHDNIMQMDLDFPERTTEDFNENISEKLQETINLALNDEEEDLTIMKPNVYNSNINEFIDLEKKVRTTPHSTKVQRPESGSKRNQNNKKTASDNMYPKSKITKN